MSVLSQTKSTTAHWDCSKTKCLFESVDNSNNTLWGVVIQRVTCQDRSNAGCFKYIRFMGHEDGNQNKHTSLHEIFWASYDNTKKKWQLVEPINVHKLGEQTEPDGTKQFPPQLPNPTGLFVFETKTDKSILKY